MEDLLCGCGAALTPGAPWCLQCFRATDDGPYQPLPGSGTSIEPRPSRVGPVAALAPVISYTRWRKTPTTFGPIGRVLLTVLVITIGLWLVLATAGLGDLGGILWMLVVTPWCLRDIWKAGQLPVVAIAAAKPPPS